jgi:hypothetical protein
MPWVNFFKMIFEEISNKITLIALNYHETFRLARGQRAAGELTADG